MVGVLPSPIHRFARPASPSGVLRKLSLPHWLPASSSATARLLRGGGWPVYYRTNGALTQSPDDPIEVSVSLQ